MSLFERVRGYLRRRRRERVLVRDLARVVRQHLADVGSIAGSSVVGSSSAARRTFTAALTSSTVLVIAVRGDRAELLAFASESEHAATAFERG